MPTSLQTSQRMRRVVFGVLSGSLSLIVLLLIAWVWKQEKPSEKPEKKLSSKLMVQPKAKTALTPRFVNLPAPPKIESRRPLPIIEPKQVVEKKVVKALIPSVKKPAIKIKNASSQLKQETSLEVAPTMVENGRVLLRLLEHGSGPSIEFAWPETLAERQRLYKVLTECHGMRVAVLDGHDQLFVRESQRGAKWRVNLDRYSTFMRQISGGSVAEEQQEISDIKERQSIAGRAGGVRIFSRKMDSQVLGGLGHILGSTYRSKKSIRAKYQLSGSTILVGNIVADGAVQNATITVNCGKSGYPG